jgi:hypothetical protein
LRADGFRLAEVFLSFFAWAFGAARRDGFSAPAFWAFDLDVEARSAVALRLGLRPVADFERPTALVDPFCLSPTVSVSP